MKSQVLLTAYDEDHDDLDDFDPGDENLYDIEDSPNDVEVDLSTPSQALLTSTITDMEIQVNNKPELGPIEYEEVDNDDTLMIEPELANKNIEFFSEDFENELGTQIQKDWEVNDKGIYNDSDNDLTPSNNIEIQNWVMKFESLEYQGDMHPSF